MTGLADGPSSDPLPQAGEGFVSLSRSAGEGRGEGAPATRFALRDATPADLPEILRLVRALADYERLLHEAVGTEADFAAALFATNPRVFCALAEIAGRAVGQAIWFYNFSTFTGRPGLYVEDVFVEPEHRGAGIGAAFFRMLAARAVAEGCGRMEWQVLDWNAPAIAFYRKIGARGMDGWRGQRLTGASLHALAGDALHALAGEP